jgi:methyl-accepting chemotaxis protein
MIYFWRRRKFFVHKALQYRLLVFSICHSVFFLVVISVTLFVPLMIKLDTDNDHFDEVVHVADQFLYLHEHLWPVVVITLLVICLHSISISHRIAGPLYRFNRLFKAIQEGHLPQPIRLRAGDYLHHEMEAINKMVIGLRGTIMDIQEEQALLNKALAELQITAKSASQEEILDRVTILMEKGRHLANKLSYFKIES